jgi:hypothetical protein
LESCILGVYVTRFAHETCAALLEDSRDVLLDFPLTGTFFAKSVCTLISPSVSDAGISQQWVSLLFTGVMT